MVPAGVDRRAADKILEVSEMAKTLDLAGNFRSDAEALRKAREEAIRIHPTDIRAAGNEVERAVRDYLKRMLPPRYYVTSGHLIDSGSLVSPQQDIIIADNVGLPSLYTTKDGTEYVPITSVHAIGEVKSTYYQAKVPYEKLHDVLQQISGMDRPLVENTCQDGIQPSTTFADTVRGSPNKYLNNLYAFLICIDAGDFEFGKVRTFLSSVDPGLLPNASVLLNKGVMFYGMSDEQRGAQFHKYPNEVAPSDYDWCFAEGAETEGGSVDGTHLAYLYGTLIEHLSNSYLEPPSAYRYTAKTSAFRRSSLMWAKDKSE